MKSNKSFLKRLKVTKNGKLIGRATGQNHFNAKESRRSQLGKNRAAPFHLTQREKRRFIFN